MSSDRVIQVKKIIFSRTIAIINYDDVCKRILTSRSHDFANNLEVGRRNECGSQIFDILNVSILLGIYDLCMQMITSRHYYTKEQWRKIVWGRVWDREDEDYELMFKQPHHTI